MSEWPIDDSWRTMRREYISRVEIIDENGRAYTRHELYIDLISVQDDGLTLKLFVRPRRGTYQASGEAPSGGAEGRGNDPPGKSTSFTGNVPPPGSEEGP
jgi:hypothetical protein